MIAIAWAIVLASFVAVQIAQGFLASAVPQYVQSVRTSACILALAIVVFETVRNWL